MVSLKSDFELIENDPLALLGVALGLLDLADHP